MLLKEIITVDHLGTPRVVTNQGGNVIAKYDYEPYGVSLPSSQLCDPNQKFALMDRDCRYDASGGYMEDNAWFRNYSNNQGRFLRPDPLYGSMTNPQGWNRYAYSNNDPINYMDPMGLVGSQYNKYIVAPTPSGFWIFASIKIPVVVSKDVYTYTESGTIDEVTGELSMSFGIKVMIIVETHIEWQSISSSSEGRLSAPYLGGSLWHESLGPGGRGMYNIFRPPPPRVSFPQPKFEPTPPPNLIEWPKLGEPPGPFGPKITPGTESGAILTGVVRILDVFRKLFEGFSHMTMPLPVFILPPEFLQQIQGGEQQHPSGGNA